MLCDYVHPNIGAHTLVVSKAELVPEGQMRWELSREPDSDEALSVLVHAVVIPVRASIRTLLPILNSCSARSATSVSGSGGANLWQGAKHRPKFPATGNNRPTATIRGH